MKPEEKIHLAVVEHLRKRAVPGVVWFHVPNAPRSAITGRKLKRMGMLAGVSDIILIHSGRVFALEIKSETGRPSPAQLEFRQRVADAGGFTSISYGLDACINSLKMWGLLK